MKDKNDLWPKLVDMWFTFYRTQKGVEYAFTPTDGRHLKLLQGKIKKQLVAANLPVDDDSILATFEGLIYSISDEWILQHLDLPLVNSKFNQLFANAIETRKTNRGYYQNKFGSPNA